MKTLLPYQKEGVEFALSCFRKSLGCLIADEMGLGKTAQAIEVIKRSDAKNVLIVSPASLRFNWRAELREWGCNLPISLIGGTQPQRDGIVICNYDIVHKLKPTKWGLIVFDECHYLKNPKAKRTKLCSELAAKTARVLALSGTPMTAKPVELYPLLQMLDPANWTSFMTYTRRYCAPKLLRFGGRQIWDYSGAANLGELAHKLRSSVMIRRTKAEVLPQLPRKVRSIVVLGENNDDGIDCAGDFDTVVRALRAGAKIPFDELMVKRRIDAEHKIERSCDYIENVLEGSNKSIVVFIHHKSVYEGVKARLEKYGLVSVIGATASDERQSAVTRFQAGKARVFLGSIGAAGTGLTLTRSSHVIFIELDWTPGVMTQCEDRVHRIGQCAESVLIEHLVVDGTLDAKLCRMLVAKQCVLDRVLDSGDATLALGV